MQASAIPRAVAAATATGRALGLEVDDVRVLHDSNKLTVRLLPCDVLARVAPAGHQVAELEIDVARRLSAAGSPVAALDPRAEPRGYEHDGFVVTLWTYYEPVPGLEVAAADYAEALGRLHAGMRTLDVAAPHFTDRVEEALVLLAHRERTPELADADRVLLASTLRRLRRQISESGTAEQLLHGEPHPGNVLPTQDGPLFIDFETCCRGPVEFDLAHAPDPVGDRYGGVDHDVLRACRTLVLAMVTTWRWDRDDEFPDGRALGVQWLGRLRAQVRSGAVETDA